MCGIAGIIGCKDPTIITGMINSLHHRGPDSTGFYQGNNLFLGACRLSIIDISGGEQPVFNEKNDKCVVFNGEIYNYQELRQELCSKGHVFRTKGDTEVIIHLYEEYGYHCVDYLQGMFSFAIADRNNLFLARDRLGIKPLYYSYLAEHSQFLFASEIKSLLSYREVDATLDIQTVIDNAVYWHSIENHTLFRQIKSVRPGHVMLITCEEGRLSVEERGYYQITFLPDSAITFDNAKEQLSSLLSSTVSSHLISDTTTSLALSGGLDSSLLAMFMNELVDQPVDMFTIADRTDHPDVEHAQVVTSHSKSVHHIIQISFADYMRAIPACMQACEALTVENVVPLYLLCQAIGKKHKICLNGEGADEVFGGYREYSQRNYRTNIMKQNVERLKAGGLIPRENIKKIITTLEEASTMEEYMTSIFCINLQNPLVDLHFMPLDKLAMAVGLEIRVPYVDHKLLHFANSLPLHFKVNEQSGKYILKQIAGERFGEQLADIPSRKKLGFPSAGQRYLVAFDSLCNTLLPEDYLATHPLGACFANKRGLLLFELFSEIFVAQRGVIPQGFNMMNFLKERAGK